MAVTSAPAPWPHDEFVHAWWVEPGRILAGEYPGAHDPTVAAARVNLLLDAGIRTFVDLTTPADRLEPYGSVLGAAATARGLDVRRCNIGIPDLSVGDDSTYDELIELIRRETDRGAVYVHCWGGIGRTGTVIGCWLAGQGLGYDGIVERLASLRAGTRKSGRPPRKPTASTTCYAAAVPWPSTERSEVRMSKLSDRYAEAVGFAITAHDGQVRKGTKVTYVSHLLAVSALVLEHGGDEDLAIAGLLHDAVEDASDGDGQATAAAHRRAVR